MPGTRHGTPLLLLLLSWCRSIDYSLTCLDLLPFLALPRPGTMPCSPMPRFPCTPVHDVWFPGQPKELRCFCPGTAPSRTDRATGTPFIIDKNRCLIELSCCNIGLEECQVPRTPGGTLVIGLAKFACPTTISRLGRSFSKKLISQTEP